MTKTTHYCDICNHENPAYMDIPIQIIDTLSYKLLSRNYDICNVCYRKLLRGNALAVHGIDNGHAHNRIPKWKTCTFNYTFMHMT